MLLCHKKYTTLCHIFIANGFPTFNHFRHSQSYPYRVGIGCGMDLPGKPC